MSYGEDEYEIRDQLRREEREACAALVEAAGCVCEDLNLAGSFKGVAADWSRARTDAWIGAFGVEVHDPRCPRALAAKIRGRV